MPPVHAPVTTSRWLPPLLAGVLFLALSCVLGAVILAEGNGPFFADAWWNGVIAGIPSPALLGLSLTLNQLGGGWIAYLVPALAGVALLLARRPWAALYVVVASIVSALFVQAQKVAFGRARPEDILIAIDSRSFPSGHTANAALLAMAALLLFPRLWVLVVGAAWTLLMAFSRTYLHAHWLSDTLGGALAGAGSALVVAAALAVPFAREAARRQAAAKAAAGAAPAGAAPRPAPARRGAEAAAAEAQLKAAQAQAALAAAEAEAARAAAAMATASPAAPVSAGPATSGPATAAPTAAEPGASTAAAGPLDADEVAAVERGYAFEGATLDLGALVNGDPVPSAQIRIPLGMMNRHGLVAGATGTGKTRTLQGLAEQLASSGVPVFAADIKGDLSGVATPGAPSDKLLARTAAIGQDWAPAASVTEYYALGGVAPAGAPRVGVPVRATITGFGPLLLSKVLGLNATQESSLGLVFHYADSNGLALVDLSDLRAVLTFLTSDEGKAELKDLGGLSAATVGVILRELITFAENGADVFFGEPEFDVREFLRTAPDGRGVISLLEVPGVADRPALYSTFLMYLLAELFEILPEVGDLDTPKLVFFFDEAHLLFRDASKAFQAAIVQTVRLIRSKGVGVFFVTQTPKDVPADVLGQLGSRVQHALRAFTPDDAKALRATVGTYPKSGYDLERVLQELGTGEAIVTVMSEKGAPTPVAWTRLRAPQGSMSPTPAADIDRAVAASPLLARYDTPVDRESAREILTARMAAADDAHRAEVEAAERAKAEAAAAKQRAADDKRAAAEEKERQREYDRMMRKTQGSTRTPSRRQDRSMIEQVLGSRSTQTILSGVIRGMFGTGRR